MRVEVPGLWEAGPGCPWSTNAHRAEECDYEVFVCVCERCVCVCAHVGAVCVCVCKRVLLASGGAVLGITAFQTAVQGDGGREESQLFRQLYRGMDGWMEGSQLLQAAVQVSLAAFSSPSPALQTEPPQILLEVLMVHGPVGLGLAVDLNTHTHTHVRLPILRGHDPTIQKSCSLTTNPPPPRATPPSPPPGRTRALGQNSC